MNIKVSEEAKRKKVIGSREEWALILSAISNAEKNMKPEYRKPQIQRAIAAGSSLVTSYLSTHEH